MMVMMLIRVMIFAFLFLRNMYIVNSHKATHLEVSWLGSGGGFRENSKK